MEGRGWGDVLEVYVLLDLKIRSESRTMSAGIGLGAPIIEEKDEEDKRGREEDAKLKAAVEEDE
ncbi:hypothetical protein WAI453_006304 [Rhynchosporium graminicola]